VALVLDGRNITLRLVNLSRRGAALEMLARDMESKRDGVVHAATVPDE
jgi:hypothetical protein